MDESDYDIDPHRDIKGKKLSLKHVENTGFYGRKLRKSAQQLPGRKSHMGIYRDPSRKTITDRMVEDAFDVY